MSSISLSDGGREAEAEARKAHLFSKGKGRKTDQAEGQSESLREEKSLLAEIDRNLPLSPSSAQESRLPPSQGC